jgi:NADH-quinone oxidoreductase subunit G
LVLTGQYSVEEFEEIVSSFVAQGSKNIFHWINNPESFDQFDGLLLRGDRNPNTKGLIKVLDKHGINTNWKQLSEGLKNKTFKTVVVAGPENQIWFPELKAKIQELSHAENLVWMQTGKNQDLESMTGPKNVWLIPMKSFVEKDGTFINVQGLERKFKKATTVVSEALTLAEASQLMFGKQMIVRADPMTLTETGKPADRVTVENRKKNEFVFNRGTL